MEELLWLLNSTCKSLRACFLVSYPCRWWEPVGAKRFGIRSARCFVLCCVLWCCWAGSWPQLSAAGTDGASSARPGGAPDVCSSGDEGKENYFSAGCYVMVVFPVMPFSKYLSKPLVTALQLVPHCHPHHEHWFRAPAWGTQAATKQDRKNGEKGRMIASQPSWVAQHFTMQLQHHLCPWAARDDARYPSEQQKTGSKCWSHCYCPRSSKVFCAC